MGDDEEEEEGEVLVVITASPWAARRCGHCRSRVPQAGPAQAGDRSPRPPVCCGSPAGRFLRGHAPDSVRRPSGLPQGRLLQVPGVSTPLCRLPGGPLAGPSRNLGSFPHLPAGPLPAVIRSGRLPFTLDGSAPTSAFARPDNRLPIAPPEDALHANA